MVKNIFILFVIISLFGCSSTRDLRSARGQVTELERLNGERELRNSELEGLLESEREGNRELGELLSGIRAENNRYIESERNRLEEQRKISESLSGIFEEGESLIEDLIRGYYIIREYFESLEVVE